jgi:glycosyltransferase involved in cell wall biosynthesis
MKLSIYTFVRDGIKQDYHVVQMLRHHLPFADEIVVHEGYSSDGSFEAISNIDPKVKIFRSDWNKRTGMAFSNGFKNDARIRCTGDWCILLDADEFIPEWDFARIRQLLERTDRTLLGMDLINFYGNYRVYNAFPDKFRMPARKMNIHRNLEDIEMHGGDASSVRRRGVEFSLTADDVVCELHHFGHVRWPARLREQWRNMRGRLYNAPEPWFRMPSWLFDVLPHNWADPDFLPYLRLYEGQLCRAVTVDPDEFTRDGMKLFKLLSERKAAPATPVTP